MGASSPTLKPAPATLGPFIAVLTEQPKTPPIYALTCAGCHGAAANLVKLAW